MSKVLIPAGGTVQFLVWNLHNYDPYPPRLQIEGPTEWVRPVVGLVFDSFVDGPRDPLVPDKDRTGKWLLVEPLVVDEAGAVYRAHDYLEDIVGELHWDHATHFYTPHVAGPVTSAPIVRRIAAAS